MDILISLLSVLLLAFILGLIFERLRLPQVVGQILAGLIFGVTFLKEKLFVYPTDAVLDALSKLGIIFLLFLAGLEIDLKKVKESSKDAILIALFSAALPFALGFALIILLGYSPVAAIIFGGALSVTAEGVAVKFLMDVNMLNTRVGAILLSAGAIDDILEFIMLSFVTVACCGNVGGIIFLPLQLVLFILLTFFLFKISSRIVSFMEKVGSTSTLYSSAIIFVLALSVLSETIGIGYLIGAIIAGFVLQSSMRVLPTKEEEKIIDLVSQMTSALFVPFFFVNVGLSFQPTYGISNAFLIGITVLIAIIGKVAGTLLVKPLSRLKFSELSIIGWGMNARGAVELVIALTALEHNMISADLYSALVTMALITTIISPVMMILKTEKRTKETLKSLSLR